MEPIWTEAEEGRAAYCQHNVDSQVHCCFCHRGFVFENMWHDQSCPYNEEESEPVDADD